MDKNYEIQVIETKPSDVILVQVSELIDYDTARSIFETVQEAFPNNKVLIANHKILEKLTIVRKEDENNPFLENQEDGYQITLFP